MILNIPPEQEHGRDAFVEGLLGHARVVPGVLREGEALPRVGLCKARSPIVWQGLLGGGGE